MYFTKNHRSIVFSWPVSASSWQQSPINKNKPASPESRLLLLLNLPPQFRRHPEPKPAFTAEHQARLRLKPRECAEDDERQRHKYPLQKINHVIRCGMAAWALRQKQ